MQVMKSEAQNFANLTFYDFSVMKTSYELLQKRRKIAKLCNFYDFSQSTLDKMVAMVTSEV